MFYLLYQMQWERESEKPVYQETVYETSRHKKETKKTQHRCMYDE